MATRKRPYIDLTGDSEDDEVEPVVSPDPSGIYGRPQASKITAPPIPLPLSATTTRIYKSPYPALNTTSTASTVVFSREQIVRPLDWSKARRNHAYDPRTIARDVLIATSSHPDKKGLNAHLEVLKTRYSEVNDLSDLSTLRWDLIELPTVAASQLVCPATTLPKYTSVSETVLPSIETSGRDLYPGGDISRQPPPVATFGEVLPQPKSTPVSLDQFESTSPPKTSEKLDIKSTSYSGESLPRSSSIVSQSPCVTMPSTLDLPSFQIPQIHRSPNPTRGGSLSRGRGSHGPSLLRNSSTPGRSSSKFSVVVTSPSQRQPQYANFQLGLDSVDSTAPASENSSTSGTSRRGRPPQGSVGLKGTPLHPLFTSLKKRDQPFRKPNDSQSASPAPGAKKRGRPFKTAAAAEAAAAASPSSDLVFKRRGRPPKAPLEPVFLPPPEPRYHPFICEWEECRAELHNLETLQNHLFDVHVKKHLKGALTCLWGSCGTVYGAGNAKTQVLERENQFATRRELRTHINHAHLVPQAWYMGDGPRGTSLEIKERLLRQKAAPWLYDAHGVQVTPSFEDLPIDAGIPKESNARRFVRKREGLDIVLLSIAMGDSSQKKVLDGETRNGLGNGMDVK